MKEPQTRPVIGYVVSQYPAINHTYILREILALRELGCIIHAVSIRPSDRKPEQLSGDELAERRQTYSVLGGGMAAILAKQMPVLLTRPASYFSTLFFALRISPPGLKNLVSQAAYFAEAVCAGDYLRRKGVRHLHTHFSSMVTMLAARLFGMKFSMTIHGSAEFNDVAGFNMAAKVAACDAVITISNYGASQVMRASSSTHWHKVRVFPLGVNPDEHAIRREPELSNGVFELLTIGQLQPAKGYQMLLAAVKLLAEQGRKVHLTMVGEGEERTSLESMIEREGLRKSVTLAGAVSHHKVVDFYRQTHAFVMTSFAEGVPVVLMEAMAMGVPCLSTRITGIPELIDDGVDGLLYPPADPQAVASAIARLMDDPGLRQRLAHASREKILKKYNLVRNAGALSEALVEIASRSQTTR